MSPALVVPWMLSTIITDRPVLQAALTKRPYVGNETEGAVLVNVDISVAEPVIQLRFGDTILIPWTKLYKPSAEIPKPYSDGVTLHNFSLTLLPPLDEKPSLELAIDLRGRRYDGLVRISQTLQLMRTHMPSEGSFSQIDFRRKGLLVNGQPFYIIGFYTGDSNETHESPTDWDDPVVSAPGEEQKIKEEIRTNRNHGLTSIMIYHFNNLADDVQKRLLDTCQKAGIFLIYPLHVLLKVVVTNGTDSDKAWQRSQATIERWRNHSAILGWYVCDDCTNTLAAARKVTGALTMETVYEKIKILDPAHVIFGAIESQQLSVFTKRSQHAQGVTLDVPMFENYVSRLVPNSHFGTQEDPGLDGSLRLGVKDVSEPLPFEALVNCPGPYQLADGFDPNLLPPKDQASIVYSLSWLAVITASIPHQLYFRRKYAKNSLLNESVGRYAKEVHQLSSFISQVEPHRKALTVELKGDKGRYKDNFRAKLLPNTVKDGCALLIVTHLKNFSDKKRDGDPLQFVVEFHEDFLTTHRTATRLRDNTSLTLEKGALTDSIATRWGTELYKMCEWSDDFNSLRCKRKHVLLPVMLFTSVISSVLIFAGYFGIQIWRTKQSRAQNQQALEMTKQSWAQPY